MKEAKAVEAEVKILEHLSENASSDTNSDLNSMLDFPPVKPDEKVAKFIEDNNNIDEKVNYNIADNLYKYLLRKDLALSG